MRGKGKREYVNQEKVDEGIEQLEKERHHKRNLPRKRRKQN